MVSRPIARSVAIAALLGTTMLARPLTVARADGIGIASIQLAQAVPPQTEATTATAETKAETVEQRITSLHAALTITASEGSNWGAVAQAMRDNAAVMQKLVAEKTAQAAQSMNALDNLKAYETFAQAHVDGLKNLIASFETLYNSMPDPQKSVADRVFRSFGREGAHSNS